MQRTVVVVKVSDVFRGHGTSGPIGTNGRVYQRTPHAHTIHAPSLDGWCFPFPCVFRTIYLYEVAFFAPFGGLVLLLLSFWSFSFLVSFFGSFFDALQKAVRYNMYM